jgi:hypothetical protein
MPNTIIFSILYWNIHFIGRLRVWGRRAYRCRRSCLIARSCRSKWSCWSLHNTLGRLLTASLIHSVIDLSCSDITTSGDIIVTFYVCIQIRNSGVLHRCFDSTSICLRSPSGTAENKQTQARGRLQSTREKKTPISRRVAITAYSTLLSCLMTNTYPLNHPSDRLTLLV